MKFYIRSALSKVVLSLFGTALIASGCTTWRTGEDNAVLRENQNLFSIELIDNYRSNKILINGVAANFPPFPKAMDGFCAVGVVGNSMESLDRDFSIRLSNVNSRVDSIDFDCIIGPGVLGISASPSLRRFAHETEVFFQSPDLCLAVERYSSAVRDFGSRPSLSGLPPVYPREAFYVAGITNKMCGNKSEAIDLLTIAGALGSQASALELEGLMLNVDGFK